MHLSISRRRDAFTLVELILSMGLFGFLLVILTSVTDVANRTWSDSQKRTEAFQSARTALEIMTRELTPAVVDTRMQFVVASGSLLTESGAKFVVENSPALLWMAPLGDDGELRCVGYYLSHDEARRFFRLKRLFIGPTKADGSESPYFPRMLNQKDPRDKTLRTSPVNASWFTRNWNEAAFDEEDPENAEVVVSTAADGVVALWVQCIDVLGNPVPLLSESRLHPRSELAYNSAAYFQVATSLPFEKKSAFAIPHSFQYLAETPQSMKANRVPAAIELTLVTLDAALLDRVTKIPPQSQVLTEDGALDVEASAREFHTALKTAGVFTARTFTTRVNLLNGR
jgi:hypothetical protein